MQNTSELYKTILSAIHGFEVKLNIAGTDYGMESLGSLSTLLDIFGTGKPTIGLAPSGEISTKILADSTAIPRMAELRPYIRAVNERQQSEWISKGVYYIDTRETDGVWLNIYGFDSMMKGERTYPSSTISWPATDIAVVSECASFLGVTVDSQTTAIMTAGFPIQLPAQYTIRETLQYIAALYGGSFVITDANTLRLIPIWSVKAEADVTAGSYKRQISHDAYSACTGIRFLIDDDTEVFAGDETGYVFEIESPWATQAAADWLLTKMQGFIYQPWTIENTRIDPACEVGDTVGASGTLFGLFSSNIKFGANCFQTIGAPSDEELDHEFPYESKQDRVFSRKIKNVQSELSIQAEQIAAKVSRTGGDASSFGWHLDADKFQLLSNGTVVMLVNEDGLTVHGVIDATSGTIGGCTIENGVLKIANANIQNLNASKITAGTLPTARIGDYSLDSVKIDDGAAVNRVIGASAVSYGKTSFQSTLDQVGTNEANIDTLFGYFEGSAQFSSLLAGSIALNYHYFGLETITIGGVNRKVVTWT